MTRNPTHRTFCWPITNRRCPGRLLSLAFLPCVVPCFFITTTITMGYTGRQTPLGDATSRICLFRTWFWYCNCRKPLLQFQQLQCCTEPTPTVSWSRFLAVERTGPLLQRIERIFPSLSHIGLFGSYANILRPFWLLPNPGRRTRWIGWLLRIHRRRAQYVIPPPRDCEKQQQQPCHRHCHRG